MSHHPTTLVAAGLGLFLAGGFVMQPHAPGLPIASAQDATYSIPGKPQAVDEQAATPGVGFDEAGGEMNPYTSESQAINPVNYHFHFYGHQGSAAPGQSGEVAGPPSAPSAPPGYAQPQWSTPMALNAMNRGGWGGGGWGGGYHFHFYGHGQGNYGMPASQGNATGAGSGFDQGAGRGNYGLPASQGNATGAGVGSAGGANFHFHFYGPPMGNPGPMQVPQGNPGGFAP
jgi:hypothetical protein